MNPKRPRKRDILRQKPEPILSPTTRFDSFRLFIDYSVVQFTNQRINKVNDEKRMKGKKEVCLTDEDELMYVLSMLFSSSVASLTQTHVLLINCGNKTHVPSFTGTMSRDRFCLLLSCIRFDDAETRVQMREVDKLAAFRKLEQQMIWNCKANSIPHRYCKGCCHRCR